MEIELLRVAYRRTEQQTLICLLLSLPLFGIIYLYQQAGNLNKTIPQLPFFAQMRATCSAIEDPAPTITIFLAGMIISIPN